MWEQDVGSNVSTDLETIALLEDMKVEFEQKSIYDQITKDTVFIEEISVVHVFKYSVNRDDELINRMEIISLHH